MSELSCGAARQAGHPRWAATAGSWTRVLRRVRTLWVLTFWVLTLGVLGISGCGRSTREIQVYEIPKRAELLATSSEVAGPATDRILGAVVRLGAAGWFLKASGSMAEVASVEEGFRSLASSLRASDDELRWVVPEGWSELDGTGMRRATFVAESAPGVDISLIVLPVNGGWDEYLLANVNRWRDQLQLPPLTPDLMAAQVERLEADQLPVTLVDLKGRLAESASSGPGGMFGGGPMGPSPVDNGPGTPAGAAASQLQYEVPEGWEAGRLSSLRKAAFVVRDGQQQAEVTVIDLASQAGDVLDNVNRWRDQVGLSPLEADELPNHTRMIRVSGYEASMVELEGTGPNGTPTTILAVIAPREGDVNGRVWFVKLTGDAQLAQRERHRFEEFVQSLQLGT